MNQTSRGPSRCPEPPVRPARQDDLASWRRLASEVEHLFGPMPDIEEHVARGIGRGTAYATGPVGDITGGMLLSRDDRAHEIVWLAVLAATRGQGLGGALVTTALAHWPAGDIEVVTFTEDLAGGRPARRLYETFGFTCAGPTAPGPDGGPRDRYVLDRSTLVHDA